MLLLCLRSYFRMLKIYLAIAIVSIITGTTASSDTVGLKFLKGVNRLNSSKHFDYYFSCAVVGRFVQWQYNEEPLEVFHSNSDVGDSVVTDMDNYIYTASLLSSEPVENNNLAMDSLLIISFTSVTTPSNFIVTCTNGIHLKREIAGSKVSSVGNSSMDDSDLVLDYITSNTIVKNGTTHIFMCGAQDSPQLLQANGPPISFSSTDQVGLHKAPDATTFAVREQGIFISRNLFNTTSVLIVADESDVNVICFYGTHQVRVQSLSQVLENTSPTPEVEQGTSDRGIVTTMATKTNILQNITTTTSSSSDTVSGSAYSINGNAVLIGGTIGAALVILIVIGILLVIFIISVNRSRPKKYLSEGSMVMFYNKPEAVILEHYVKNSSLLITRVDCNVENPTECEDNMKDRVKYSSLVQTEPSTLKQGGQSTLKQGGPSTSEQGGSSALEEWGLNTPEQEVPATPEQIEAVTPEQIEAVTPEQIEAVTPEQEGTSAIKQRGLKSLGLNSPQKESGSLVQRQSGSPVRNDVEVLVNWDKHHTSELDFRNVVQSVCGEEIMPQQSNPRHFKINKYKQEIHAEGGLSVGDELSQVQEGGAQFAALASGKLRRTVYIKSDGQTFACSENLCKLKEKQERQSNLMRVLESWCKPAQDLLHLVAFICNATTKSLQLQMAEYWAYEMPLLHDWEKKVHTSRAASPILHKQLHDKGGLEDACILTSKGILSTDNLLSRTTVRHRKGAQNTEGSVPCSPSPCHFLAGCPLEAADDHRLNSFI